MDIGNAVLVVIDMQTGFVNHHSRHAVPVVSGLVAQWTAVGRPVLFTRYFNYPDSPYERFFQWHRLQEPPETDIVTELAEAASHAHAVVDKTGYTLFTPEGAELIRQAGWTDLVFCGIATESCVLKSAADAFEHGHTPWIVTDACASDAGSDMHDAGLLVARRLIGTGQLIATEHVREHLTAHTGVSVPDGPMAEEPPRIGSPAGPVTPATHDTDLLIIGGGPAGCAAARMAASVGMRSILVEPDTLCRNLYRIPALNNVPGGYTSGPELADAITTELRSTRLCRLELGRRVTGLHTDDDHVTVTLDTGACLTAPYAVVATGVGPLQLRDVTWITAPSGLTLPALWQAEEDDVKGRTLLVLGGDRPIGTFLRAHPTTDTRLIVAYPQADDYKTEEIREDPRVTLLPVEHLKLSPSEESEGTAVKAEALSRDGERHTFTADAGYLSIGNTPTAPSGDLVRGTDGYCPPTRQHPRIIVAGDLRSARFQRITTALGSGSEAALSAFYAARELLARG